MSLSIPVPEIVSESQDPLLAIHPSWERVPVGLIASVLNGFAFKSSLFTQLSGLPLLRIRDVGNDRTECCYDGPYHRSYVIQTGDFVVGMDGDFKSARWHGPKALLNQRVCKIALTTSSYNPRFLEHALPGYLRAINERTSSQTVRHLSSRSIAEIPAPLPPIAEQNRIATKIDELLQYTTASLDRLAKVARILRSFRQSVLAAACSGRLTEDWREKHPETVSAETLVESIRQTRLKNAKAPLSIVEPVLLDRETEELPELPNGWRWAVFGSVIGELRNGISTKPEPQPPGHPVLRISSVRPGVVLLDDHRFLPGSDELTPVNRLWDGDLLFTRYNGSLELLGVCGMVRGLGKAELLYPDKLMRVRFDHPYLLPPYVEIHFQSSAARDRMTAKSKSSAGQQGISGADLKVQPLALPSVEEQKEIVRRVEALFELAGKIERRVEAATKRANNLTQAILAKAFRGELVPTEAELARREGRPYEPASVLLERIKAQREHAGTDMSAAPVPCRRTPARPAGTNQESPSVARTVEP
jgi:type I restriction enzyme S subunit